VITEFYNMVYGDNKKYIYIYIYGGGAHGHGCFRALINVVERQKPCIYFAQRIPVRFVLLWGRRVSWVLICHARTLIRSASVIYIYIYIYKLSNRI
jgi:hypothetical protein